MSEAALSPEEKDAAIQAQMQEAERRSREENKNLIRDENGKAIVSSEEPESEKIHFDKPSTLEEPKSEDFGLIAALGGAVRPNTKDTNNLDHKVLSKAIHIALNTLSFNDRLFVYENGVYVEDKGTIRSYIIRAIQKNNLKTSESREIRDVYQSLHGYNHFSKYPFNWRKDNIPVLNGVLRLDYKEKKITYEEHKPENRFSYKLPIVYNPEADTGPIDTILKAYTDENEELTLLYQIVAQSLLQISGRVYKKSYLLKGPKNAGKSSYIELITRFFGAENISGLSLQELQNKFAFHSLEGKLVNIYDDLSKDAIHSLGIFKNLTGRTDFLIEPKHRTPYMGKINCVHIFSANEAPQLADRSDDAFWSRWEIILFGNAFEINGDFYDENFTPGNLSGFLNRVLEVCLVIMENGLITHRNYQEIQDLWLQDFDDIYKFLQAHTETDPNGVILKDDLIEAIQKEKPSLDKSAIGKKLKKNGCLEYRPIIDGKQDRYYKGRKWRNGDSNEKPYKLTEKINQTKLSFL